MSMIVHQRSQPMYSWQWRGDNFATAPLWVRQTCWEYDGELVHERRSGRQVLVSGEWLVRDLDGAVTFRTPEEFAREFRA